MLDAGTDADEVALVATALGEDPSDFGAGEDEDEGDDY
jgi:hypothetical protein